MLPGHTRFAGVTGERIAYHRSGSGPVVLLVHGITTYSFIWRRIIPLLEDEYDVVAVDLLGCGESDMPLDTSYAIQDQADRLWEFMNELGIEHYHYVGHDLGGGIGQILAVRHPEVVRSLTLVNSVGYDFWPVQPITALRTPIIRQFMMASFDLGTFRIVVNRGIYHSERLDAELMSLFTAPFKTSRGRKAFMHFARCLDNHNLTEIATDLRQLKMPVMIVRGDADPYLSPAIAEKLHAEIPGSRLERIATASHFLQEDEPEWLADLLRDFMGDPDDRA